MRKKKNEQKLIVVVKCQGRPCCNTYPDIPSELYLRRRAKCTHFSLATYIALKLRVYIHFIGNFLQMQK